MKSIAALIEDLFRRALTTLLGEEGRTIDPLIRMAGDDKFGDYQSNVAMGLGKRLGQKPRDIAQRLVDTLNTLAVEICEPFEIAGPGFINIRLRPAWIAAELNAIAPAGETDRMGIEPVSDPQTVVVDYSSPNIAKEMHVGHLRSTIIGDGIARILEFEGHQVIRQNHIGDWGTQFGMVILGIWHLCMAEHRQDLGYLRRMLDELGAAEKDSSRQTQLLHEIVRRHEEDLAADPAGKTIFEPFLTEIEQTHRLSLEVLLPAYRFVNAVEALAKDKGVRIQDPRTGEQRPYDALSNYVTVMLQDVESLEHEQERRAWRYATVITMEACERLYQRLNVSLRPEHVRGESFYHPRLGKLVENLASQYGPGAAAGAPPGSGLPTVTVEESQGAICLFLRGPDGEPLFKTEDDRPLPMIIRKSDGAFNYDTTDLAAIDFRVNELKADRILYLVGAPQIPHFKMLFTAVRALGWTLPKHKLSEVQLEHVWFGSVLGDDNKPLKTRSGDTVKLADLLDEAVSHAEKLICTNEADPKRKRDFTEDEIHDVAEAVGIGAVKYADLCQNRQSDYLFSWSKMMAMDGNTASYLMYAYARIRSIHRKGQAQSPTERGGVIALTEPLERALGKRILQLVEILDTVALNLKINLLTDYLYDLSGLFMRFFESCPVLSAETVEQRVSRLSLCDLTARTLRMGLSLLGIRVVERM